MVEWADQVTITPYQEQGGIINLHSLPVKPEQQVPLFRFKRRIFDSVAVCREETRAPRAAQTAKQDVLLQQQQAALEVLA